MVKSTDTVDPFSARPSAPSSERAVATVEVLFHSDLARIGDRADLAPVHLDAEVVVGREAPTFVSPRLVGASLADPCLSRAQARVRWRAGAFEVVPEPGAKRDVRVLDLDGQERSPPFRGLPPGTVVAFGDRAALLLTVRPADAGSSLGMVGASAALDGLRRRIVALAAQADTVLVRGETGTGKELVARALHDAGPRAAHPFIALNCAAVPENLVESELFGYAKGAFSGATQARAGLFQAAGAGTLFLDEIGELSLAMQAKLLRVLEVRRVRPVGAPNEEPIAARIVAATHRDLADEVAAGRFRADLFARIEAPLVEVPPLRERRDDVPRLFAAFLRSRAEALAASRDQPLVETPLGALFRPADAYPPRLPLQHVLALVAHAWPRNVRELVKHAADVEVSLLSGQPLPAPPSGEGDGRVSHPGPAPASAPKSDPPRRARPGRDELAELLEQHDYHQANVARALGVPYTTLDRWLRELGVVRPRDLSRDDIERARRDVGDDVPSMAKALRVSVRGLKARIAELGLAGARAW